MRFVAYMCLLILFSVTPNRGKSLQGEVYHDASTMSSKISLCKISWYLEAPRFGFKFVLLIWNMACNSMVFLKWSLPNFEAISITELFNKWSRGFVTSWSLIVEGFYRNMSKLIDARSRTYFRHICSHGVNFMQLWFFVWNRFLIYYMLNSCTQN